MDDNYNLSYDNDDNMVLRKVEEDFPDDMENNAYVVSNYHNISIP